MGPRGGGGAGGAAAPGGAASMARPLAADAGLVSNVPGLADNLAGIAAVRPSPFLPSPAAPREPPAPPLSWRRPPVHVCALPPSSPAARREWGWLSGTGAGF